MDLDLDKSSFFNWERRGTIPSGDVVAKIADYFHVSTDYLLGRTDDPSPVGEVKTPTPDAEDDPLRSALLYNFSQLNREGQERLVETSDDMVSSRKYIKSDPAKLGKTKEA